MRYYKVIKDHPLWINGAIISDNRQESDAYFPTNEIFCKDVPNITNVENWNEGKGLVENSPEFFERVYKVENSKNIIYNDKVSALKFIQDKFNKL